MKNRWEEKTKAERGVAHIIRRPVGGAQRKPEPPRKLDPVTVPAEPLEDSGEVLVTPVKRPNLRAPAGKDQRTGGDSTGTLDELTVEDAARPLPPLSLVRDAVAAPVPAAAPVLAQLVIAEGNDRGRNHPLVGERTTVGRGVDNDIVLTDISVSRHHLVIEFDGMAHWVRDLGSGNGTLINDRDHDGRTRLCHGDHLELGNTVIRYDATDAVDSAVSTGNWRRRSDDEEMSTIEGRRDKGGAQPGRAIGPPAPPARRRGAPSSRPPERQAARMPPLPAPVSLDEVPALPDRERERAAEAAMAAVRAADASSPGAPLGALPGAPMPMPGLAPSPPIASAPMPGPAPVAGLPPGPAIPYPSLPAQIAPMYPTPSYGGIPRSGSLPSLPSPPPARRSGERRKLVIGAVSVALVLVGIGIVAALTAGGDGKAAAASAEPEAEVPAVAAAAPEPEAEPALPQPEEAAAPQPAPEPEATPIPTLASLRTGTRELPATAWGTDEGFVEKLPEPETDGADAAEAERERDKAAERERKRERDEAAERERKRERDEAAKRERERRDSRPVETEREERPAVDSRAIKAEALALYKQQQFTDAADTLRAAVDELEGRRASELRELAAGYGQVGNLLATAERSQRSDAPAALRAYKRALQRDEQVSGGVHSTLIRLRIGQVAPRAARAHMTKKRYDDARRAADDAVRFGAADDVAAVLGSLERRAERALDDARERIESGDVSGARDLLEEILGYAPKDSAVRARASRELDSL